MAERLQREGEVRAVDLAERVLEASPVSSGAASLRLNGQPDGEAHIGLSPFFGSTGLFPAVAVQTCRDNVRSRVGTTTTEWHNVVLGHRGARSAQVMTGSAIARAICALAPELCQNRFPLSKRELSGGVPLSGMAPYRCKCRRLRMLGSVSARALAHARSAFSVATLTDMRVCEGIRVALWALRLSSIDRCKAASPKPYFSCRSWSYMCRVHAATNITREVGKSHRAGLSGGDRQRTIAVLVGPSVSRDVPFGSGHIEQSVTVLPERSGPEPALAKNGHERCHRAILVHIAEKAGLYVESRGGYAAFVASPSVVVPRAHAAGDSGAEAGYVVIGRRTTNMSDVDASERVSATPRAASTAPGPFPVSYSTAMR